MNKKTPTNTPHNSGSGGVAIGTGAGCGIVTIVLVLLWLGLSAYAAANQHESNPHYAFAEYFVMFAFFFAFFLVPALCIAWAVCGVLGVFGWFASPPSKPDVLADKAPVGTIWDDLSLLFRLLIAAGILLWIGIWLITRDPLWFLQML